MAQMLAAFRFHLFKFRLLFRREQLGNFRVRDLDPRDDPPGGLAANRLEIAAGFLHQWLHLFHLRVGQAKPILQVMKHVPRHLPGTGRPHKSAADHGGEERSCDHPGEENQ